MKLRTLTIISLLAITIAATAHKCDSSNVITTDIDRDVYMAQIYPIIENDYYGFINEKGEVIVAPKYKMPTSWGMGVIVDNGIAYDYDGHAVTSLLEYNVVAKSKYFYVCYEKYEETHAWFFVREDGTRLTKFMYSECRTSRDGKRAIVKSASHQYILIDLVTEKKTALNMPYYIQAYSNDKMLVTQTDQLEWSWTSGVSYAIYDISGQPIIGFEQGLKWDWRYAPYEWNMPDRWIDSEGMILYRDLDTGMYGYYNEVGVKTIEPKYKYAYPFMDGRAVVAISDDQFGTIDVNGSVITPTVHDKIKSYSSGMAPINVNGKWGYIDVNGKVVIEPKYDYAGYYDGNIAYVERDGKAYYINKEDLIVWEHEAPDRWFIINTYDVHTYDYVTTMKIKW